MWLRWLMWLGVLPVAATGAVAWAMAAPEMLPEPVVTRQTAFSIPFRVDPLAPMARDLVEVQLYVSTDRGASWKFHSRIEPQRGPFVFRADKDGEYWFLIRTLSRSGQLLPRVPKPGLRVVVDTAPPRLLIDAKRGDAGQVNIQWQVQDLNAAVNTLKVQCRTAPDQPWQSVFVDNNSTTGPRSVTRGDATWWPPNGSERIEVRGEIADSAGNTGVGHAQVVVKRESAALTAAKEPLPGGFRPSADVNHGPSPATGWQPAVSQPTVPWRSDRGETETNAPPTPVTPTTPTTAGMPTTSGTPPAATKPTTATDIGLPGLPAPTPGLLAPTSLVSNPLPAMPANSASPQPAPTTTSSEPPATGPSTDTAPQHPSVSPSPVAKPEQQRPSADTTTVGGTVGIQVQPSVAGRSVASHQTKSKDRFAKLPPGQKPRWVNSRRFQLEYDVESVGPSGVSQVELWGTRDGGKLWTSFGLDEDKRSPFVVMVDDEGMYGFRIAVESGAGLGGDPPPADAPADIWIGVDLSKPACTILSTEPMTGEPSGRLLLRWDADDVAPATKPVSLFWSEFRDGPWTAIATGLEDTGQYIWTIEPGGPTRPYLRLEVRDEAGNLGIHETPEPVTLDRARPSVRIREIRPIEPSRR